MDVSHLQMGHICEDYVINCGLLDFDSSKPCRNRQILVGKMDVKSTTTVSSSGPHPFSSFDIHQWPAFVDIYIYIFNRLYAFLDCLPCICQGPWKKLFHQQCLNFNIVLTESVYPCPCWYSTSSNWVVNKNVELNCSMIRLLSCQKLIFTVKQFKINWFKSIKT